MGQFMNDYLEKESFFVRARALFDRNFSEISQFSPKFRQNLSFFSRPHARARDHFSHARSPFPK
jgi:hypothetical protein